VDHLFSILKNETAITLQLMGLSTIKQLAALGEGALELRGNL
jgi:hypothetical protein